MIDFHGRTYPAMAIQYILAVQEFSPYFCEEPVPPDNVEALLGAKICARPDRYRGTTRRTPSV
jgi:L-alanine-DL-glutamate epimerase-like enolase superfamily enzyme